MSDEQTVTRSLTPPHLSPLASRYAIEGELGTGGMGAVYRARDLETGEAVAIKVLKPEVAADPEVMERFKNELRLARRITHKNVCRIHEFNRVEGMAFISMELVDGESLRTRLQRPGGVSVAEAIDITLQICAGLREAHLQGIVHRDLKPENIMVDRAAGVKVMDFGIARSADSHNTATGMIMGTPSYMPPEQVQGKTADTRSDIYSLGLVLYEMFTGRKAFSGETALSVAFKQISETPPRPTLLAPALPPAIGDAIVRCIEKDPARRFQTVDELAHRLRNEGSETLARPTPVSEDPTMLRPSPSSETTAGSGFGWRRPLKWALLGAVVVGAAILAERFWPERPFEIPIRQATLKNGLQVVISEDHSAPTFTLAIGYKAGAAEDSPDHPGLAHLLEHLMMFTGSAKVGRGEHQLLIKGSGGVLNATTNAERVLYWEVLPSNQLNLALFLEADRMRSLRIEPADFAKVRSVVIEEIRTNERSSDFRTGVAIQDTAFDTFAYRHPTLGTVKDLERITPEQAATFFRGLYVPNNAVLTLVGDVEPSEALSQIRRHFEEIPEQTLPSRRGREELGQTVERRRTIEDPLAVSHRLDVAYKVFPHNTADRRALEVLAHALGGGPSSRLHRKLVAEKEVAVSVTSRLEEFRGASLFLSGVIPQPGKDTAALFKLFDEEVRRLQTELLADVEFQRVRMRVRQRRLAGLESTMGRAFALSSRATVLGDPTLFNAEDRELLAVRPGDVQRVAKAWLKDSNRTLITTNPAPGVSRQPAPQNPVLEGRAVSGEAVVMKNLAPVSKDLLRVRLPRPTETSLDNGLALLILEDRRLPRVWVQLRIRGAGPLHEPAIIPGLAAAAAQMLREGSSTRTGSQIAEELDRLGFSFTASAATGTEDVVLTFAGPSDALKDGLALLADIVRRPAFAADDLNRLKARLRVRLKQDRSTPPLVATEYFRRAVYGRETFEPLTLEAIDALTPERLLAWHKERFVPQSIILGIAGDVRGSRLAAEVRSIFGDWPRTQSEDVVPPKPVPADTRQVFVVDVPGSRQVTLKVGNLAVDRRDADFVPLSVLNGLLTSRLFNILREQKGYAYSVGSLLTAVRSGGDWSASGEFRSADLGATVEDLTHEIRRLCNEKASEMELEGARRALVAGFALSLERPSQVLDFAVTRKLFNFSADYWDNYPGKVMDVAIEDVQRVGCKYLDVDKLQIVAVGDAKPIVPVLRKYGKPVVTDGRDALNTEIRSKAGPDRP